MRKNAVRPMEKGARLTTKGASLTEKGARTTAKGARPMANVARRIGVKKLISGEKSCSALQPRKS